VILSACAALSAMLAALLVPLRWGTVIVPVSVLIAVASTAGLILLAWRADAASLSRPSRSPSGW
jgi:hypothetical protein